MNKKILISGIIICVILISGCSKNTKDGIDSGKEKSQSSEDRYEIKDIRMGINDSGKFSINGKLKNPGNEKGYTEILIPCYNKEKEKLDNAFDSVEHIDAGGEWKFRAVFSGEGIPKNCVIEEAEVITY